VKPVTPRTTQHLTDWCEYYQLKSGIVPQPPHIRFSIGVYQISQGMSWKCGGPVAYQSYAAAAMHFLMSSIGFAGAGSINDDCEWDDEGLGQDWKGWEHLMYLLGRSQQMVVYSDYISSASKRKSRFDLDELLIRNCLLIDQCFALIPPSFREEACYNEMFVLTGEIKIK
jgi:hypothetical protein